MEVPASPNELPRPISYPALPLFQLPYRRLEYPGGIVESINNNNTGNVIELTDFTRALGLSPFHVRNPSPGSTPTNQSVQSDAETLNYPSPSAQSLFEAQERNRAELAPKMSMARADTNHQCAICLDNIVTKAIIHPCFHQFCHMCLFEWFKQKVFCPVCRQEIRKVIYNIESDTIYEECSLPMPQGHEASVQIQISVMPPTPANGAEPALPGRFVVQTSSPGPPAHSIPEYTTRFIRVTLIQMLAVLHDKYPELGFPCSKLDYKHFREAINFPAPEFAIPDYFRCYIYMHKYNSLDNLDVTRANDLTFLQNNPTVRIRLITFVKNELSSLKKAYVFGFHDLNQLLDQIDNILKIYDIQSEQFKLKFRNIISKYCNLTNVFTTYDVVEKLYEEFCFFSKSPFTEYNDHCLNIQYMSKQSANGQSESESQDQNQQEQQQSPQQEQPSQQGQQCDEHAPETSDATAQSAAIRLNSSKMAGSPAGPAQQQPEHDQQLAAAASISTLSQIEIITISDSETESSEVEWIPPVEGILSFFYIIIKSNNYILFYYSAKSTRSQWY